jgi:hypothetical protein
VLIFCERANALRHQSIDVDTLALVGALLCCKSPSLTPFSQKNHAKIPYQETAVNQTFSSNKPSILLNKKVSSIVICLQLLCSHHSWLPGQ